MISILTENSKWEFEDNKYRRSPRHRQADGARSRPTLNGSDRTTDDVWMRYTFVELIEDHHPTGPTTRAGAFRLAIHTDAAQDNFGVWTGLIVAGLESAKRLVEPIGGNDVNA